jgi:hypothetical protein
MRVILEVISGATAGRKVRLTADQELRVGRTEWADFAVPHDSLMSGVHFALRSDSSGCYLTDLGSSNGTLVNGQPVTARTLLRAGDEIRAGETRFAVSIDDESRAPGDVPGQPAQTGSAGGRFAGDSGMPAPQNVRFSMEACSSGLTLCRGNAGQLPPDELAGLIVRQLPLYLMVDFRKLGSSPPGDAAQRMYLFPWLPPAAAAAASPVILASQETSEWKALIAQGWGSDAVVCLFSRQDKPTVVEHLRNAVRVKGKRGDLSGGVLGICWPSVMAMLLAHGAPALVRRLLAGIDAVLVELPDLPDTWQVYGENAVTQLLEKSGLMPQDGQPTTNNQ